MVRLGFVVGIVIPVIFLGVNLVLGYGGILVAGALIVWVRTPGILAPAPRPAGGGAAAPRTLPRGRGRSAPPRTRNRPRRPPRRRPSSRRGTAPAAPPSEPPPWPVLRDDRHGPSERRAPTEAFRRWA